MAGKWEVSIVLRKCWDEFHYSSFICSRDETGRIIPGENSFRHVFGAKQSYELYLRWKIGRISAFYDFQRALSDKIEAFDSIFGQFRSKNTISLYWCHKIPTAILYTFSECTGLVPLRNIRTISDAAVWSSKNFGSFRNFLVHNFKVQNFTVLLEFN